MCIFRNNCFKVTEKTAVIERYIQSLYCVTSRRSWWYRFANCLSTESAVCTERTCIICQGSSLSAAAESNIANQQNKAESGKCSSHVEENLHRSRTPQVRLFCSLIPQKLLSVFHSFVVLCLVFCACCCTFMLVMLPYWRIKEYIRVVVGIRKPKSLHFQKVPTLTFEQSNGHDVMMNQIHGFVLRTDIHQVHTNPSRNCVCNDCSHRVWSRIAQNITVMSVYVKISDPAGLLRQPLFVLGRLIHCIKRWFFCVINLHPA